MIDTLIAVLGCAVLYISAMMVVACIGPYGRTVHGGMMLTAGGMALLGTRYAYLIGTSDIARLSIYGTASIGAIALGGIIICVEILRK